MPDAPPQTPGQHCARWLKAAKAKHTEANTVFSWEEVAKLIDTTIAGLNAFPKPAKAQKSEEPAKATPEAIYEEYPRKVGRKAAIDAIKRALIRKPKDNDGCLNPDWLLLAVKDYASAVSRWPADERNFVPHPATWFNQGRYDDDPKEWVRGNQPALAQGGKDYTKL